MKNTLKKTYKELSNPFIAEVYALIDGVCKKNNISCYLIGAQARDINLLESGIRPMRGTMDIDFAVMLPDMNTYENVFKELLDVGFRKTNMPYRIIYDKTDTVIDILPFGEIEEVGTVKFIERQVMLSVIGFKEVNEIAQEIQVGDLVIRVTPMEGIFILKLVSWNEKPIDRSKDLEDLQFILKNYFELNSEIIYDHHTDFFEEISEQNFQILAGARVLGRDMAKALNLSQQLKLKIENILKHRLQNKLGDMNHYQNEFRDEIESMNKIIIEQILKGINE
jgi:predicted nucleotidyltransferase